MMMEVKKESWGVKNSAVTNEELSAINTFTKRALGADEVYTFAVRLCDNEVDRDGERFPRATLEELAELFVGKSGIFDHEWSAKGQAARIYRTEVVEEEGACSAGEGRCYLKGYAYMLRGGANDALIAEIEGGIKKEVSVGCSVAHCRCSVCGEEMGKCAHRKGERYGGLKMLVKRRGSRANLEELETLEKQAALGARYMSALREEAKRWMLVAEQEADGETVEKMLEKLDEGELKAMERIYHARAAKKLGLRTQLTYGKKTKAAEDESDFRV